MKKTTSVRSTFPEGLSAWLRERIAQSGMATGALAREAGIAPAILYRFLKPDSKGKLHSLNLETVDKILPLVDSSCQARLREQLDLHAETCRRSAQFEELVRKYRRAAGRLEEIEQAVGEALSIIEDVRSALAADATPWAIPDREDCSY
jgi:hypothetical protein